MQTEPETAQPAGPASSPALPKPVAAEIFAAQNTEPALEHVPRMGLLAALLETVQQVLFHPRATFEHMAVTGSILRPLLFAVAMALLVFLGGWGAFQITKLQDFADTYAYSFTYDDKAIFLIFSRYFWMLFVGSGLAFLTLKVVAPKKAGFERAFRVVAYVQGSTLILGLVQIFGVMMLPLWHAFALITALKASHQIKLWQAIVTYVVAIWLSSFLHHHLVDGLAPF